MVYLVSRVRYVSDTPVTITVVFSEAEPCPPLWVGLLICILRNRIRKL